MDHVKILDCTLRDGGYYNNWDFSNKFAKDYIKSLSNSSVNSIEIGFRKPISTNIGSGQKGLKKIGNFLTTKESFIKKFKFPKNKTIAVMIDLADFLKKNNFEYLKKNFPDSKLSNIKLVRIACNHNDKSSLPLLIKYLKNKNYMVAANLMKFTILSDNEIYSFFNLALNAGADYLYLADSFGSCSPNKLNNITKNLQKKGININKLGFHSHDNTGSALKNTIAAIKNGFVIIDTSLMGMGRGAGNLKLEEFLNYQKKFNEVKQIKNFTKKNMSQLMKKYKWGKNKFYIYSAKNSIHPTFVQRLIEEKKFNIKVTTDILKFLKKNKAMNYDMNIFDNLFLKTQSINQNYTTKIKKIAIFCDNKDIQKLDVKKLKSSGYIISSLNFTKYINHKFLDLIFQSNAYRVFTEVDKILKIKKIKLIVPHYVLLKGFFKKFSNKIIKYNIYKNKKLKIKRNYCCFDKNLVLIYALCFCISNKINEIKIFGLTKSSSNLKIIDIFKNFKGSNSKFTISVR